MLKSAASNSRLLDTGRKRLMIITPALTGGGAEKVAVNLAAQWADQGHDVSLVSMRDVSDYDHLIPPAVTVRSLGAKRARFAFLAVRRVIRDVKPHGILSVVRDGNIITALSAPFSTETALVFREANTLHGLYTRSRLWRYVYISAMQLAYRRAQVVIANSEDTLSALGAAGIAPEKACVIPNPVVPDNYSDFFSAQISHPWFADSSLEIILSVGRLHPQKDFPTLIRAFSILAEKRPSARLVIIGKGEEYARLLSLVSELRLTDKVDFLGFVANPWPYYRCSNVFALSSRWEGFGNVLVESMASGTPVVVTDCPGGPRIITGNGKFGRLVPVGDVGGFAAAMEGSLKSPPAPDVIRRRAEEFGVRRVSQLYFEAFGFRG